MRAQIFRDIRLQSSIPGEDIAKRERRRRDVQLGLKAVRPVQFPCPLDARRRQFQEQLANFRARLSQPPGHVRGKIGRGVRDTLREPPAVQSGQSRRAGKGPLRRAGIRAANC